MTDYNYRDLCAELVSIADAFDGGTPLISNQGQALDGYSALAAFRNVADRARAALAEPVAEPPAVAERPSDDELGLIYHDCCGGCEFMDQGGFEDAARAVLARWGQPPAPPAEGEVAEMLLEIEQLAHEANLRGDATCYAWHRAAELAESPSPSSQKEVASLVTWLREQAEIYEDFLQSRSGSRRLRHVANLLEKTMPEPVAVSERLPGTDDLDSDGRC